MTGGINSGHKELSAWGPLAAVLAEVAEELPTVAASKKAAPLPSIEDKEEKGATAFKRVRASDFTYKREAIDPENEGLEQSIKAVEFVARLRPTLPSLDDLPPLNLTPAIDWSQITTHGAPLTAATAPPQPFPFAAPLPTGSGSNLFDFTRTTGSERASTDRSVDLSRPDFEKTHLFVFGQKE